MKKRFLNITIIVLLFVGLAGTVWGSTGIEAARSIWNSCTKGRINCYYPGDCRSYIDTNGDQICDRSQSDPAIAAANLKTTTTPVVATTAAAITTASTASLPAGTVAEIAQSASNNSNSAATVVLSTVSEPNSVAGALKTSRYSYYLVPLLLASAFLYTLTWVLAIRKKITLAVHRKIWNSALLVYALVSCLLGILLVIRIETGFELPLPFDMLFWHVEAGIAMSVVAIFHIIWHRRYFTRLFSGQNKTQGA
jgi:hypothetical protein